MEKSGDLFKVERELLEQVLPIIHLCNEDNGNYLRFGFSFLDEEKQLTPSYIRIKIPDAYLDGGKVTTLGTMKFMRKLCNRAFND